MKSIILKLRRAVSNQVAYRKIRDEIAQMPRHEALDLGMYPEDAERIARKAVWG
jgi:uncharacterized protein YjiS (DUF1127 family)